MDARRSDSSEPSGRSAGESTEGSQKKSRSLLSVERVKEALYADDNGLQRDHRLVALVLLDACASGSLLPLLRRFLR